jgi:hypothetical protein
VVGDLLTFDVSAERNVDYSSLRKFRYIFAAIFVLIVVGNLSVLATFALEGRGFSPPQEFALGAFAVIATGVAYVVLAFGPGPTKVEISAEHLSMLYDRGTRKEMRWDDAGHILTLWKYPETFADGTPSPPPFHYIVRPVPLKNPVSSDAFSAILLAAERRGLSIRPKVEGRIDEPTKTVIKISGRLM